MSGHISPNALIGWTGWLPSGDFSRGSVFGRKYLEATVYRYEPDYYTDCPDTTGLGAMVTDEWGIFHGVDLAEFEGRRSSQPWDPEGPPPPASATPRRCDEWWTPSSGLPGTSIGQSSDVQRVWLLRVPRKASRSPHR